MKIRIRGRDEGVHPVGDQSTGNHPYRHFRQRRHTKVAPGRWQRHFCRRTHAKVTPGTSYRGNAAVSGLMRQDPPPAAD